MFIHTPSPNNTLPSLLRGGFSYASTTESPKKSFSNFRPPLGLKTTPFADKAPPLNRKNDPRGSQHFKIRVLTQKRQPPKGNVIKLVSLRSRCTHRLWQSAREILDSHGCWRSLGMTTFLNLMALHLSGASFLPYGNRKGGTSPQTGATKCPGDTWLARGRFPCVRS